MPSVARGVVVDTYIWVNFFGDPQSEEKFAVDQLIDEDRVIVVGPVLAEIVQGCQNRREAEWVASLSDGLRRISITDDLWRRAGLLGLKLRSKGAILPLSDLVTAVAAMRHDFEVYSTDPHFRLVPGLRLYMPR